MIMDVWLFSAPDGLQALSSDEAGSHLPEQLGPWRCVRLVELQAEYYDEQRAIALINTFGFCCFE